VTEINFIYVTLSDCIATALHASPQRSVVERLLLGIRRLLLRILVAASHSADESTGRGTNSRAFPCIASDCAPDRADCCTARGSPKGAWAIGRGLRRWLRWIIATLLRGPAVTSIIVLVLLRLALTPGRIDDHTLRLAWHSDDAGSNDHESLYRPVPSSPCAHFTRFRLWLFHHPLDP
jgi:hypothetical protein